MTGHTPTTDVPEPGSSRRADQGALDRALIRGVAWTGAFRWLTQILNWAITIVLARILTPSDYGMYGFAALYVGLVQLVNEFGLGAAIIRRRDLSDHQVSAIGGVSIALGATLWGLSFLLAPVVANFFDVPDLRWPLVLLSSGFLTTAIRVLPKSLMARDLLFRRVAALDAIELAIGGLSTLALALLGFGYWSLMSGVVVGSVVATGLALLWRPHPLGWPRTWSDIGPAVAFGSHVMVARLAWYGYSNGDNAVVGKRLGQALLGAYTHAWTLASLPVDRISGLVAQVTPAIFSAVQHDQAALRRYLLKITEGLALLTFPMALGLACVADLFVTVLLGEPWWPVIAPLAILAFYGGLRSVTTPFPHVLQAVGESGRAMRFNIYGLVVLIPMFLAGSRWGLVGVALAWIVGYPIITYPMFQATRRITGMHIQDYLEAIRPPLVASVAMASAVIGIRYVLPTEWPDAAQFLVAVTTGAITYTAVIVGAFRERLGSLKALLQEMRR